MRKSRIRIRGDDRFLMMLARDVRRRWLQYGTNRNIGSGKCNVCRIKEGTEIDHIEPVGKRFRAVDEITAYVNRMLFLRCQRLCKQCHLMKTKEERNARKIKRTI